MTVSIDGQASASLWLRELDSLNGRILPGTSGASYPFWSPDSRWVGFFAENMLKRIDVAGGPALTLCDVPSGRGGSWNQDDIIVYGRLNSGLFRVPAAGGTPVALTEPDGTAGEFSHPQDPLRHLGVSEIRRQEALPLRQFAVHGVQREALPQRPVARLHVG